MTYLSTEKIAKIEAQIIKYEALLLLAEEAYAGALGGGVKSYKFDGGDSEASQQATRHGVSEMLANIGNIEAKIRNLEERLTCAGIFTMRTRRG